MEKIIHQTVELPCDSSQAFEWFTQNELLESWLTKEANVEPVEGGKYELFFNPPDRENDSTIGCKVTKIVPNELLCFDWKGPKKFQHFMNKTDPLTHVAVFFLPSDNGTIVHLVHSGWRDSKEWEEARKWFVNAWGYTFEELREHVKV